MVGAIGVHLGLYKLILRRSSPLFGSQFHIPSRKDIDPKLLGGAAVFGWVGVSVAFVQVRGLFLQ